MKISGLLIVVIGLIASLTAAASSIVIVGDIEIDVNDFDRNNPEQRQIRTCLQCHGPNGGGDQDFSPPVNFATPSLQGLPKAYLIESLSAYRQGRRLHPEMQAIAALLSAESIESIAIIIESLPVAPLISTAKQRRLIENEPEIEMGEKLAEIGDSKNGIAACSSCHGLRGVGIKALGPRLAGQNQAYLLKQLKAFSEGSRNTSQAAVMKPVASALNAAQRKAVGRYYQALVDYQVQP